MVGEPGSQVVRKVGRLLGAVAESEPGGLRLVDAAHATEIPHPTAHRILQELMAGGFLTRDKRNRYHLGMSVFELSLSAPTPIRDLARLRELAQDLANFSGDTVYVAVRQFDGINYIVRAEGDFHLRIRVPEGQHRVLPSSYAGIALLPFVNEALRSRSISARAMAVAADSPEEFARMVKKLMAQVMEKGFLAGVDVVLTGVSGIAAPIPANSGLPYAAVSISAPSTRLPTQRIEMLSRRLLATARQMRSCFS